MKVTKDILSKPAPKMLERGVCFVVGCLSFMAMPFCFLVSLALVFSVFGGLSLRDRVPIFYALPLALLFGLLGVVFTVVEWRLVRYKQNQRDSLLAPFVKWFRDLGWVFAFAFGGDGVNDIIHGDTKGTSKLLLTVFLLFAIRKSRKLKQALLEDKSTADNAFNSDMK